MVTSCAIDVFISEKTRISFDISLEPSLLIEHINEYMLRIKYELSMAAWKQFKSEKQFATMYVRLFTPAIYDFCEKFELSSIEKAGIQIERAAENLCLKIRQEIVMDLICSSDFRNLKIAFEK